MLELRDVTKYYGKLKALDGVSFRVNNGEIVGFVGVNGAGKTTTIKISAGVLRPTSGLVLVDGIDMFKDKVKASMRVGWVPELPAFEEEFRAKDYLVYLAGYYGITGRQADELAERLLSEVGLKGAEHRRLREYSQGMKKRFALTASMISDPTNYLFDEVLNGLDPQGIAFFRQFAVEARKGGKAVLFSSHILSEVQNVAGKVVFIHRGRIIAVKGMEEVLAEASSGVKVTVENPDEKLPDVLSRLGRVVKLGPSSFEVVGALPQDVNAELVRSGYRVRELTQVGGLEDYFFRLIGGEGQ